MLIKPEQAMLVKSVKLYIYGDPSLGKSSICFTAKNCLLIDFDLGAYRTGDLRRGDVYVVEDWETLNRDINHSFLAKYDTIAIDTVQRLRDCIISHYHKNPSNRKSDGGLKLNVQGLVTEKFRNFISLLTASNKDIIFIAHAEEHKNESRTIIRPDLGGKGRQEIYRLSDQMAYLTNTGSRQLLFSQHPDYHSKDSARLGNITLPDLKQEPLFLANIIQKLKDHLNSLSKEQTQRIKDEDEYNFYISQIEDAESVEQINELMWALKSWVDHTFYRNIRNALIQRAEALKMVFNHQEKQYEEPQQPDFITSQMRDELQTFIEHHRATTKSVCKRLNIRSLLQIPYKRFEATKSYIQKHASELN